MVITQELTRKVREMRWEDREAFLLNEACRDFREGSEIRPCFLAMAGDQPLFVAFLRPYEKGGHLGPLIEVIALAAPLDADRLAVSLSGRAWSLDDPVVPVIPGVGDLRQRVLLIEEADASSGQAIARSSALPYELEGRSVRWGEPVRHEGGSGIVSAALALAVRRRGRLRADDDQILAQAERCQRLGHLVALAAPVRDRLLA